MTIEVHGHVESLGLGPMTMVSVTIRIASARSQELLTVFATRDELANQYYPGKGITIRITPNP